MTTGTIVVAAPGMIGSSAGGPTRVRHIHGARPARRHDAETREVQSRGTYDLEAPVYRNQFLTGIVREHHVTE